MSEWEDRDTELCVKFSQCKGERTEAIDALMAVCTHRLNRIRELEVWLRNVSGKPAEWRSRGFRAGQEAEMVARHYYADELEYTMTGDTAGSERG